VEGQKQKQNPWGERRGNQSGLPKTGGRKTSLLRRKKEGERGGKKHGATIDEADPKKKKTKLNGKVERRGEP